MMIAGSLNVAQRTADLERLAREPLDVLVIGGGITGAGVAALRAADLRGGVLFWDGQLEDDASVLVRRCRRRALTLD